MCCSESEELDGDSGLLNSDFLLLRDRAACKRAALFIGRVMISEGQRKAASFLKRLCKIPAANHNLLNVLRDVDNVYPVTVLHCVLPAKLSFFILIEPKLLCTV